MNKVLYHYTSTFHLPMILNAGYLKLTESNLRYAETMYKPVVWLTTSYEVKPLGMECFKVNKQEVRITVEWKNHFKYWKVWSKQNKIDKKWAAALEKDKNADTWWISEKEIPLADILKIENIITGEIYFFKG